MENRVRIFRENPIAWWDKPVMRHLRKKYGANKRLFVSLRGVYLALCEIESDFVDTPITFFTQTVGTYAGVTREVAGRCIKLLEDEGLVVRTQIKEEKTHRFSTGTVIMLRSLTNMPATNQAEKPLPRIASSGDRRHRGSWATYKNISDTKKTSKHKNVKKQREEKDTDEVKIAYFADQIARKLGDTKSVSFYRQACLQHDPQRLLEKAHEIMADGGARNPGAVFVKWLNGLQRAKQSETI